MNKRLEIMLQWLIDSHLLIALAAVAFTDAGWKILNGSNATVNPLNYLLIFLGAFLAYNLYNPFLTSSILYKRIQWVLLIILFIISTLTLTLFQWIYLAHLGWIVLIYDFSIHNFHHYKNRLPRLRNIPLLKIFMISYVWASLGSFLPAILDETNFFDRNNIFLFLANFCLVTGITIPFDIRDFARDKTDQVSTLPGLLGIEKAKMISILLLSAFVICFGMLPGSTFPAVLLLIPAVMLVLFTEPDLHRFYFTGLIDSLLILYWLLVVIIR